METNLEKQYKPYMNIGPGAFIKEELEANGLTDRDLIKRFNNSEQLALDILNDRKPINSEIADVLGEMFGQSAEYWLNLNHLYQNYKQ